MHLSEPWYPCKPSYFNVVKICSERTSRPRGCLFPRTFLSCMEGRNSDIDGGWGWIVVGGGFLIQLLLSGLSRSNGVIYVEVVELFDSSNAEASFLITVMLLSSNVFGPIANILSEKFSERFVVLLGSLTLSGSIVASAFSQNIVVFILLFSGFGGFGIACVFSPPIAIVSKYFYRRRAIAVGLIMTGGSVSAFIIPYVIFVLVEKFAFRGMMLIFGGILLNIAVGGACFRPICVLKRHCEVLKPTTKRSVFLNPRLYSCGLPLSILTSILPMTYSLLPPLCIDLGLTSDVIPKLLLCMGIPDLLGRIGIGLIADKNFLTQWQLLAVINAAEVATWFVVSLTPGMVGLYIFASLTGLLGGASLTLMAPVAVEAVGIAHIHKALGIVAFMKLINVPLPIVLGWIRDATGSWLWSYRLYGLILLCCNFTLLMNFVLKPKNDEKTTDKGSSSKPSLDES